MSYDNLERLKLKDIPLGELNVNYAYDNQNRLTSATQTGSALAFGYDALGRRTSETGPHGTVGSAWDLAGRRTRITHPDGFYVDQDYLVTGEVSKIRENGATTGIGVLATFGYDNLGERTSLTRGNGTSTTYGYDAVSRLTSLTQNLAGTTSDVTLTFTNYSPAGEIGSRTSSNDAYAYTASVNKAVSYTANGRNQYSAIGTTIPTYDAKGNLTSDGTNTYGYSSENLLTSAGSTSLTYDPAMRLSTIGGTYAQQFGYDGAELIGEYDTSGVLARRYVFGPGSDEPLVLYSIYMGVTNRNWLHADERGSTMADTRDDGTKGDIDAYDDYGQRNAANWGRYQYTGQFWLVSPDLLLQGPHVRAQPRPVPAVGPHRLWRRAEPVQLCGFEPDKLPRSERAGEGKADPAKTAKRQRGTAHRKPSSGWV